MDLRKTPLRMALLTLLLVTAVAASAAPGRAGATAAELKRRIYSILNSSPVLKESRIGVYIKVLRSGRVLYAHQSTTPMIPASNLKVLTTAAGLDRLGPYFKYQTDLVGPVPDEKGIVQGNLYLRGSGDPTITPPYNQPAVEPFRFFVRQLRQQGVKGVKGDLVADDSVFDREFLGQGWFERYRLDSYAAPVAGLSLNGNVVELVISSDGIRTDPPTTGIRIVNKTRPGGYTEVSVNRPRGSDVVTVQGTVAPGDVARRGLTVDNPPMFAVGAFQQVLRKGGLQHQGSIRLINPLGEPALANRLKTYARYESPPLYDIVSQINEESDNLFAEHLFKTLGERSGGRGSARTGEDAVKEFLIRGGVDVVNLQMVDGCGLSVLNRVTPMQMVGALEAMHRHPYRQYFWESLPTGGEGTLAYRLSGLNVRAKTGTLQDDTALSGYVVSSYGQTISFAMFFNSVDSLWPAIDAQDRIVRLLATWPEEL